ncbi:MAG TPA: VOC family protein [Candidatus Kapabacteria bacterium]|jgi:catechol 2,3-dioxygenase-like lactoylglutathione lyase family enzyme|nr:VOC family protein [Candidatus Kapabacteria bacterium]
MSASENASQHAGENESGHAVPSASTALLGLRTAIYNVTDLDAARAWYAGVLGIEPYFSEPFYVGFDVCGYELGLLPDGNGTGRGGVTAYWGVADAEAALARLLDLGATGDTAVQDVGGGIRTASVLDPWGNVFGIIENPHFKLP